jgi:hypothetical protein
MLNKINNLQKKIKNVIKNTHKIDKILQDIEQIKQSLGRIENRQIELTAAKDIQSHEFKVSSQNGEDGIIQFLIGNIEIANPVFIELGIENYTECNTRFLLTNNNWSGLVIDGSQENINYVIKDPIYWRQNLKAVNAFVTKENVNDLFRCNGLEGEIGLLSVDIDGNDYWVWQAIDSVYPAIVVIEYNYRFGKDKAVTVPYDCNFFRTDAHYSNIYFGASLKALVNLGRQKGYTFIGCNTFGNNAFFVREDLKPDYIKELSVNEGYVMGKFREARDEKGELSFLSFEAEQKVLNSLPLLDVG